MTPARIPLKAHIYRSEGTCVAVIGSILVLLATALVMVSVVDVAPETFEAETFAPSFCHWINSGSVPLALTFSAILCPNATPWDFGLLVIIGAEGVTVSVATKLVTAP